MTQIGIISFYGEKPAALVALLQTCQEQLVRAFGAAFQPYAIEQIHATIIGMEQVNDAPGYNHNLLIHRQERRVMDIGGFLAFLRTTGAFPFLVQMGGFADRSYPFTSRGRTPHARSFTIQGNKAVLMGWPVDPKARERNRDAPARPYPTILDRLRRSAQPFNILHKYHAKDSDIDNDMVFRLGLIDTGSIGAATLQTVTADLRTYLSVRQPLLLTVQRNDIAFAAYTDERLPPESTQTLPLDRADLSSEMIQQLYSRS